MIELVLPWPPKGLSPNARLHWAAKSKITKAYRQACWALAMEAKWPDFEWDGVSKVHLWIDFYPPDRRHRDMDNMLASSKAAFDGIADALGVNDKRFSLHPWVKDEIGGMIKIRITPSPEK